MAVSCSLLEIQLEAEWLTFVCREVIFGTQDVGWNTWEEMI